MEILSIASAQPYRVHVGPGLLGRAGELLREAGLTGRAAVVFDAGSEQHLPLVRASLAEAGFAPTCIEAPRGEAAKTLAAVEALWGAFIGAALTRADLVVALGGGAIGDAAGFAAATYHRGVALVHAPTTLLAQVDSSVGGKVAIDHPLGKNLVGAFHPPRVVIADTSVLETLPVRERYSGLAEVAKAALLGDLELLALLERDLEKLAGGEVSLEEAVVRSIRVKARVVASDEREAGPRMFLNLGHTVGHALEAALGLGPLRHGEAVVIGLRGAVKLSRRRGLLDAASEERALALLRRFPAPDFDPPDRAAVVEAALRDKKAGRFVALERIGAPRILDVSRADLEAAVNLALEKA